MRNNPDPEQNRESFIQDMYRVYWANMSRSMEGIWKVLAPLTVAGTILAGVHRDYLPTSIGLSLSVIVILWAVNITIDLNAWHRRNLFFLTKAEHQFLKDEDYGVLLPAKYKKPPSGWIECYKVNLIAFIVFLLFVAIYGIGWKLKTANSGSDWLLPTIVLIVGLLLSFRHHHKQEDSAKKQYAELFPDEVQ